MWYDTNPYEVGMGYDWMVDLQQASDFIGKEALAKIREEGPKRKLVGVEIGGSGLGSYNDGSMIDVFPVHLDGSRIGKVTSACYSPRLEKNIGYAMVPIEHSELGTELRDRAAGRDGRRRGREDAVRGSREGDPEAGAEHSRRRAGLSMADSALPATARAVVIGAGIVGNSLVGHLARLGWSDLVLIDKGPLPNPGGSTGHASNFIYPVDHSREMTALTLDSMGQYEELGVRIECGGLEVARTEERMEELRRRMVSAAAWGVEPVSLVTPGRGQGAGPLSSTRA